MEGHKAVINIVGILLMVSLVFADFLYAFGNRDTAFIAGTGLYILWSKAFHHISTVAFSTCIALLIITGTFYIFQGPSQHSERLGQWVFVLFLLGLCQYILEIWKQKKI